MTTVPMDQIAPTRPTTVILLSLIVSYAHHRHSVARRAEGHRRRDWDKRVWQMILALDPHYVSFFSDFLIADHAFLRGRVLYASLLGESQEYM